VVVEDVVDAVLKVQVVAVEEVADEVDDVEDDELELVGVLVVLWEVDVVPWDGVVVAVEDGPPGPLEKAK
jgi:hypothetical protein